MPKTAVLFAWLAALVPALSHAEPPAHHATGAMPGIHRVATADPNAERIAVFTGLGFGLASDVVGTGDSHQRMIGSLAASFAIQPWLAVAVRFDGRYDAHSGLQQAIGSSEDTDSGLVGDPRVSARVRRALNPSLHAGGQVTMWLPGRNAPSIASSAISFDVLGTVTYAPAGGSLRAGVNAGFRLDNSAKSAEDAYMLSQADRLSLGVSDDNAILLGAGVGYRVGRAELLGEFTIDLLTGDSSPSPTRLAAGVRLPVSGTLVAQAIVEANIAGHPTAAADQPLVPFEPSLTVNAGLHYRFGATEQTGSGTIEVADEDKDKPDALTSLTGRIVDDAGDPVADASVEIAIGDETRATKTDEDGQFQFDGVPSGPVDISVTKDGFEIATKEVTLDPDGDNELNMALAPGLPEGQLRGYVRTFGGKGLSAKLTVEPIGKSVTANADGSFELDVAPGKYEVVVTLKGYAKQRRKVTVEEGGVTILNVDLRRKKR